MYFYNASQYLAKENGTNPACSNQHEHVRVGYTLDNEIFNWIGYLGYAHII